MRTYSPKRTGLDSATVQSPPKTDTRTWGWPQPARHMLAALSILTALGLGSASLLTTRPDEARAPAPQLEVDLNTAPAQVLSTLPQVGPALVDRILASRHQQPLASLADARARIAGLGSATVAHIAPHVSTDPTPILASNHSTKPPKSRRTTASRTRRLETALATRQNQQ